MKKITSVLLLALLAGMVFSVAVAEEKMAVKSVSGTAVTIKADSVTVKSADGEMQFAVNDKTSVVREGKEIAVTDIKAGDKLTVSYSADDETKTAVAIGVKPGKA